MRFDADEDCIVRRTRRDGVWGEEEREENRTCETSNPIVLGKEEDAGAYRYVFIQTFIGEPFKIYILIGDASFIISVDGQPFCTFAFRMPLHEIRAIRVHGDVQCVSQIDHRRVFPTPKPAVQFDDNTAEFSSEVPIEIRPGHIIVITAIPFGSPTGWFDIRLLEGTSFRQEFHFNPRFGPKPCVVRNAHSELSK